MSDLKDEASQSESTVKPRLEKGPLKSLLSTGEVVSFRAGNRTRYMAAGLERVTLADLLRFAETCVDPSKKGRAGRRAGIHSSRDVHVISKTDLTRMKGACYPLAREIRGLSGGSTQELMVALQQIGPEAMVWDPNGGPGRAGDWTYLLVQVSRLKEGDANAISAMRKLLDLAATHCIIARSPRHDPAYSAVRSEWTEVYNRWRAHISGRLDRVDQALIGLLQGCHRVGLDPRDELTHREWPTVIEAAESHFLASDTDTREAGAVRAAYRLLKAGGLIHGPEWDGRQRQQDEGVSLFSGSEIAAIAELYASDRAQEGIKTALKAKSKKDAGEDYRLPTWPDCEALEGLVEGPYGLRAALTCFTAPEDVLMELEIPSRSVYPGKQIRASSPRARARWRFGTVRKNLESLAFYFGWVQQNLDIDFSLPGNDLRVLFAERNLKAFWYAARFGDVTTDKRLHSIVIVLARLASPFGEGVAMRLKDVQQAQAFERVSAMLNSDKGIDGYPAWARTLKEEQKDSWSDRMKRKAQAVEAAWTRSHGDFAFDRKEKVLNTLIGHIESMVGLPLEKQAELLARGELKVGRKWARTVLIAMLWADQLYVPLRTATIRKVDREDRHHNATYSWIWASIPPLKMKRGGGIPFEPNYRRDDDSEYPCALYRLYVIRNGARDILRTDANGRLHPVPAHYVPDVRRTESQRLTGANIRKLIRAGLRLALRCESNCLDGLTYADVSPVATPHSFRHAFGTKMVDLGLLQVAAHYLHHRSLDMVSQVYSAQNERDYDPGAARAKMRKEAA